MTILEELRTRNLYADCTDHNGLSNRLTSGPITLYCGFDPTSDSLHVGNLVPLFALRRFQLAGHHPIALAGGATGMIGDPSGKSDERNLQTSEQVRHNIDSIKTQLTKFLDFDVKINPARLVNNADWTSGISYLDFLRDYGKYFTVNVMMAKESVSARMQIGISYTEFSYMLLQAFDFYHLRNTCDCELQVGATDQWGNITAGTELIRKKLGVPAYGLTFPLLTKADGTKYGKTASGAVWLDSAKTSPYRFYQFFMQADDAEIGKLLRTLSFLPAHEIEDVEKRHAANPSIREAQRLLAGEMTHLVHGTSAKESAFRASQILFGGLIDNDISLETFEEIVGEIPTKIIERTKLSGSGISIVELLVHACLSTSKGNARKEVENGGIYLNNQRVGETGRTVTTNDLLFGKYLLLRKGKRTYTAMSAGV
jgi:tyrosyl-tRNA synthetase